MTEFKLPELGENIETADVSRVLVSEGDIIEAEQPVLELETEKAVFELPCPHAGKIAKLNVKEGDTIKVGQTVLEIEKAERAEKPVEEEPPKAEAREEKPPKEGRAETRAAEEEGPVEERKSSKPPKREEKASEAEEEETPRKRPAPEGREADEKRAPTQRAAEAEGAPREPAREAAAGRRTPAAAGPATRRLARELGVALDAVEGHGPGGRITREDVKAYARRVVSGDGRAVRGMRMPELPDFRQWGPVERRPMSRLLRSAAEHLSAAWQLIPHVTQHEDADITELEAARKRYDKHRKPEAPKITMTVLAVKAVVAALRVYPHVNSSYDAERGELIVKQYHHIGIAVDTEHGLLVPVIRDADRKSVVQIAAELTELAERARNRKLGLDEMRGGTFTITNLGGIGGTAFTPIVNWPEVAILGMSRARRQPVYRNGELEPRLILPLCLSYDHRVVNGADAARFVVKVAELLSDPGQLLIES